MNNLQNEGFDKKKFDLTYCNLHSANETLKYYSDQNISKNTNYFSKNLKDTVVINLNFLNNLMKLSLDHFQT